MATNTNIYAIQNFEPMPTHDQITDLLFSEYEKGNISDSVLVQII